MLKAVCEPVELSSVSPVHWDSPKKVSVIRNGQYFKYMYFKYKILVYILLRVNTIFVLLNVFIWMSPSW